MHPKGGYPSGDKKNRGAGVDAKLDRIPADVVVMLLYPCKLAHTSTSGPAKYPEGGAEYRKRNQIAANSRKNKCNQTQDRAGEPMGTPPC